VSAFLLSGYDTCIALLFSLRDPLLFEVVVDRETMRRYIPNSESEDTSVFSRPGEEKVISHTQAGGAIVLQPCILISFSHRSLYLINDPLIRSWRRVLYLQGCDFDYKLRAGFGTFTYRILSRGPTGVQMCRAQHQLLLSTEPEGEDESSIGSSAYCVTFLLLFLTPQV
jgi:hypothetical protein